MRSRREGVAGAEGWKSGPRVEQGQMYGMGEETALMVRKARSHGVAEGGGNIDCLGIPRGGGEFPGKGQPYLMLHRH